MPPAPDPDTRATLAGPLCDTGRCQCDDDPVAVGEPEPGFKRFKVELGPSQSELWATIDNNVFYKSVERASACFFIDLRSGEHPIGLRARGKAGFGAGLAIRELGPGGLWWYESFNFSCGAPGLCDLQSLRDWRESVADVSAGKHAPCGSVRILGIDWITGRMPDNLHPADFKLDARMKVYEFVPKHAPGTADCVKSE